MWNGLQLFYCEWSSVSTKQKLFLKIYRMRHNMNKGVQCLSSQRMIGAAREILNVLDKKVEESRAGRYTNFGDVGAVFYKISRYK